ncbi:hypothetical protein MCUN1_001894 [Malassezia cuniculi]|uniref:FAD dependent oxidoreductase domain-containing protein n=1 Tax=Malassezia cuniculi TaxID=948313 RepID=A0AAF0ER82_9BASI|nr:hypothetical protein MCUN1_001894 [Malassezia cuniculi]
MSDQRQIVIVGGGIIGASVAYYLTQRESCPAVTLVEATGQLAPGASGKAGGFLALDWHGMSTSSLASLSYRLHKELADANDGANRWGYRQVETHQLSLDASRKPRRAPAIDWLNHNVFLTSSVIGGNGSTAQVSPGHLTNWLVGEAEKGGLKVRLSTKATGVQRNDQGHVTGVAVSSGGKDEVIPATDVVIATGPWTGKLLETLFSPGEVPSYLRNAAAIEGSRAHSIIIQAAQDHQLSADCFFTEMRYGTSAGAPEVYIRPKGVAYVCGATDDEPVPEYADQVSYDPKATAKLQVQASVLSPDYLDVKNGATLLSEQSCYLPLSPRTAAPIIGGSATDGIYIAAGHAVWGINNSLGTGKVLVELMLDGKAVSADIRQLQP